MSRWDNASTTRLRKIGNAPLKREKIADLILKRFEDIAKKNGYIVYQKQSGNNRLKLEGNVYFEFGDLRVETNTHHVVVEVESAGGVSNLVKYWYCIEKMLTNKPIFLLHIFRQESPYDYGSHLKLWSFLSDKMSNALSGGITAICYTYHGDLDCAHPALIKFQELLKH